MAFTLLNRAYTLGQARADGAFDIGDAQPGFVSFAELPDGDTTYVFALQGLQYAFMSVRRVGSVLQPVTTYESTEANDGPVTFSSGLAVQLFSDIGRSKLVYIDDAGLAVNADQIFNTFSLEDIDALKSAAVPTDAEAVRHVRNVDAGDRRGAFYLWDPTSLAASDEPFVVASVTTPNGRWLRQNADDVTRTASVPAGVTLDLFGAVGITPVPDASYDVEIVARDGSAFARSVITYAESGAAEPWRGRLAVERGALVFASGGTAPQVQNFATAALPVRVTVLRRGRL